MISKLTKLYLDNLWKWASNREETNLIFGANKLDYRSLLETEKSDRFYQLMKNRLVLGAFRYGLLKSIKPNWDRCNSIRYRLKLYEDTGNKEVLVDIANMALLEFEECKHPKAHFKAIDDGLHTKIKL